MKLRLSTRISSGLTILYLAVAIITFVWVDHSVRQVATDYQYESLLRQSKMLTKYLRMGADNLPVIDLPHPIAHTYEYKNHGRAYLIVDKSGKIISSSSHDAVSLLSEGVLNLRHLYTFQSLGDDTTPLILDGMVIKLPPEKTNNQEFFLIAGRFEGAEGFIIDKAASKISLELVYLLTPLYLLSILFSIFTVIQGMRPLNQLANQAKKLTPDDVQTRLDETLAPSEAKPLVHAINRLISRIQINYTERHHFLTDSAHQLRTPLAVMRARIDQLPDFPGKSFLEQDINHLSGLIRQLLTLAQIEGKPIKLVKKDIIAIVKDRMEQLAPLALKHGNSFQLDAPDQPVLVELDEATAGEAIGNVLDNAIRFSPKGKDIEVNINMNGQIQIHDRGPGVDAEKRPHLFKRTWQDSGREDGVGLGLAIVGEIMRKHYGTASITDREGGGSTVTLQFNKVN